MTTPLNQVALCSVAIGDVDGDAPEWLHLIPAGEVRTNDGRGPYRIADAAALMASSLPAGEKLVLDENHSTDLLAPKGGEAPARGWIVELQQRDNGIWGRIEWTAAGRTKAKEYRGLSPVIAHRKDGTIVGLLRASLTNAPNFQGLVALHQETKMDLRGKIIAALGLGETADDDAIVAAIRAKLEADSDTALQSALAPIIKVVGLADGSDAAAVLAGVQQLKDGAGDDARVVALQSELAGVTTQLNTLAEAGKRKDATAFVDGAIAAGRVGVKPLREKYITMHMANPADVVEIVNAMPILKGGAALTANPPAAGEGQINDANQIAIHATAYQKAQAAAGITIDYATACRAVHEGKHK